jgi:hypothetical protein
MIKKKYIIEISSTVIGVLLTGLTPLYIYIQNNRFFYIDDKVADYLPKLLDIARILKSGEFPFISTSFMNGSVYVAEFQEGIFNPFILLSSLLLDQFDNLALGASVLTSYYLIIGYLGYYLLARAYGLRTIWANTYALAIVLNCFFIYWYTSAWFNPVQGTVFLPYALWAAQKNSRHLTIRNSLLFVVACFLTVSAGWPATVIIMFLFLLLILLDLLFIKKDIVVFGRILVVFIATGLVCTLPILPLILSNEMFTRMSAINNNSNFLAGSLKGILMFSFPWFKDFIRSWVGYSKLAFNTYYAGWFTLSLLVCLNYRQINIRTHGLWVLMFMTIFCGMLILGPEHLGPLRFPIRMVHYYHIFLLLSVLVVAQNYSLIVTRKRIILLLVLLGIQGILSLQVSPEQYKYILLSLVVLLVFNSIFLFVLRKNGGFERSAFGVLVGSSLIFIGIYSVDTIGRGVDWNVPSFRNDFSSLNKDNGYILYNGVYLPSQKHHKEFRPATTGLIWKDRMINGYSPLGNKLLRSRIKITDHGLVSTRAMKNKGKELFMVDKGTGLELLELMKVSRIISFKGEWAQQIEEAASDKWSKQEKQHTYIFDHTSYIYPGHISWMDDSLTVTSVLELKERGEKYRVTNSKNDPSDIVFARIWWPGYNAIFDGKVLEVKKHAGFLITVSIPAASSGVLKLQFTPPGFQLWLYLAVIGILLIIVMNLKPLIKLMEKRDINKISTIQRNNL